MINNFRNKMCPQFWLAAGERALKTFAQAALGFIAVGSVGMFELNWVQLLNVSLLAALVSILTSIASLDEEGGSKISLDPPVTPGRHSKIS